LAKPENQASARAVQQTYDIFSTDDPSTGKSGQDMKVPADFENTRESCGVLKALYSIGFFNRFQDCCSGPFVLDSTRSDPFIITISLHAADRSHVGCLEW
jgi:hypothetical protein